MLENNDPRFAIRVVDGVAQENGCPFAQDGNVCSLINGQCTQVQRLLFLVRRGKKTGISLVVKPGLIHQLMGYLEVSITIDPMYQLK